MSVEPRRKRQKVVRLYADDPEPSDVFQEAAEEPAFRPYASAPDPLMQPPAATPPAETGNALADLDELTAVDLPNDTVAALQLLQAQFPRAARVTVEPVILRSQLYHLVKDRTLVDRQLDELRQGGELRMFKLPGTLHEYAYMFAADYAAMVQRSHQELKARGTSEAMLGVLDWFMLGVVPKCNAVSVSHGDLLRLLASAQRTRSPHASVKGDHVGLLLNCGLLTKHTNDTGAYWFAVPHVGQVVKSLVRGRKEILGLLSRKRYPEMFVRELEARKLQYSILGGRFHVRDLVGSGAVLLMETTSGPLLRLNRKT